MQMHEVDGEWWPKHHGVGFSSSHGVAGGTLDIDINQVTLTPGRIQTKIDRDETAVVHTKKQIRLILTRLLPPWINVHLVVEGDRREALAGGSILCWRRWHRELSRAGFDVVAEKTWIGKGAEYLKR